MDDQRETIYETSRFLGMQKNSILSKLFRCGQDFQYFSGKLQLI